MRGAALCLLLLLAAVPVRAENYHRAGGEEAVEAAPSNTLTITSTQKCYDQIGPVEAHDVRTHFERPYEECLRRLSEKMKREQQEKAEKAKAAAEAEAPTPPSNYYRVQKPKKSADKPAEKPVAK